jgi:outer membrane lipoprotein-sorting protein
MKRSLVFLFLFLFSVFAQAQLVPQQREDINVLVQKVKDKINLVNDYEANGRMKTNVVFLKVPVATIKLYFKKPNRLRIKNEKGISFVPKGAVNINMSNVLSSGNYSVLDAGNDKIGNTAVKVVKLLPEDDNADVVLSTLYIDPVNQVILKTKTTTRDNGTYELEMSYGKYISYGLPDKIIFSFNTKDYKMPKGVTFDFEDGSQKKTAAEKEKLKNQKGKMEISISGYTINKGIADSVFN